jgi:hypothetical protein
MRAQPRRFIVTLVREGGSRAPRVLVELPDDAQPLDVHTAKALAAQAMDVLADRYGWPLPVGVHEHVDGVVVTEVNLFDPGDVSRAVAAHRSGDATFVLRRPEDTALLTWHRRRTA